MSSIFFFSDGRKQLVYLPLRGKILKVSKPAKEILSRHLAGEKLTGIEKEIVRQTLGADVRPASKGYGKDKAFKPTRAMLIPTLDCSLRCMYCFSSAGEKKANLGWEAARAAIDLVVKNAIESGEREAEVQFCGGGEPFMNWQLMRRCVEYAGKASAKIKVRLRVTTNGILSPQQTEWAIQEMDSIMVSFDGPTAIQNTQRPMVGGGASFKHVFRTLKALDLSGKDFTIRSTISRDSVGRMAEIVDFIADNFPHVKFVCFEPLFEVGRCKTTGWSSPDPAMFIKEYKKAYRRAGRRGLHLRYSGSQSRLTSLRFCGAVGGNFVVAPGGVVTSCPEVTSASDRRSHTFIFGGFDPVEGGFQFDQERIRSLMSRSVEKIRHCDNCFAKYNCCGDCPAKVMESGGDMYSPEKNFRCRINREILKYELLYWLDRHEPA